MASSIIGRVRDRIGGWSRPSKPKPGGLVTDSGKIAMVLAGASPVGSGSGPGERLVPTGPQPTHVLYTMTVPARESFPTDIAYASIVIEVDDGSVRVVSPTGKAQVWVGLGKAITADDGTVLLASGSMSLPAGQAANLSAGNTVSSTDEALDVTGREGGASLTVSAVISALDVDNNLCWICPGSLTS